MAYMRKLEPSVLVIPNPLRTGLVPEALPIEVEYLQEDIVVEGDCRGSGTWVRIAGFTGAKVAFDKKN